MPTSSRSLEMIYLKIFKVVILSVMSLCLVGALIALAMAGYRYNAPNAKVPAPAKPADVQTINPDEFVKTLAQREAAPAVVTPKGKLKGKSAATPVVKAEPKKYLEEAKQLEQCDQAYQAKVNAKAKPVTEAQIEFLRGILQRLAESRDADRGQPYATDAVRYTCAVLTNPEVIALGKEGKAKTVFFEALGAHIKQWDAEKVRVKAFERKEADRVLREKEFEQEQIAAAKASALTCLTNAGIAFGAFLALALYLILAAAENNLRGIDATLRALCPTLK